MAKKRRSAETAELERDPLKLAAAVQCIMDGLTDSDGNPETLGAMFAHVKLQQALYYLQRLGGIDNPPEPMSDRQLCKVVGIPYPEGLGATMAN